jgi:hypothetical protein
MAHGLLQGNAGHLTEPGRLGLLFEGGERGGGLLIGEVFLPLLIRLAPQVERPVVDVAGATKRPRQRCGLRGGGVESVAIGA